MEPILLVLIVLALLGEAYLFFALRKVLQDQERDLSPYDRLAERELSQTVTELTLELERTAEQVCKDLENRAQALKNLLAEADNRLGRVEPSSKAAGTENQQSGLTKVAQALSEPQGEVQGGDLIRQYGRIRLPQTAEDTVHSEGAPGLPPGESEGAEGGEEVLTQEARRNLVFQLAERGATRTEIARRTGATRGEIDLLLDLRRQGKI
jgi:hypothetical protein